MDFKTAALAAFDHEAVDTRIQGFQRHIQGWYDVENFNPRLLKNTCTEIRASRGRRDEFDALLDYEIDHVGTLNKRERHVHTKRLIGHFVHLGHFAFDRLKVTR